jgi:hypothetical protein
MKPYDKKRLGFAAFKPDRFTIQDALIISALYVVQTDLKKCQQIKFLAKSHPLFDEKPKETSARVNKFTNWMQGKESLKAVEAAAHSLKPQQRRLAFEFAVAAALIDNVLTDKMKSNLHALAFELAIDDEFFRQQLTKI